jgi:hypothetical protein
VQLCLFSFSASINSGFNALLEVVNWSLVLPSKLKKPLSIFGYQISFDQIVWQGAKEIHFFVTGAYEILLNFRVKINSQEKTRALGSLEIDRLDLDLATENLNFTDLAFFEFSTPSH